MKANQIYVLVRQIPAGRVSTYGEIAKALGSPNASRAVARVLAKNPELVKTPCHRIVYSDGRVGGYVGGVTEKIRLLDLEGVKVNSGRIIGFKEKLFNAFMLT